MDISIVPDRDENRLDGTTAKIKYVDELELLKKVKEMSIKDYNNGYVALFKEERSALGPVALGEKEEDIVFVRDLAVGEEAEVHSLGYSIKLSWQSYVALSLPILKFILKYCNHVVKSPQSRTKQF